MSALLEAKLAAIVWADVACMGANKREARDVAIRRAYSAGHKLETIARATGLSKQRISQIVKDGEQ